MTPRSTRASESFPNLCRHPLGALKIWQLFSFCRWRYIPRNLYGDITPWLCCIITISMCIRWFASVVKNFETWQFELSNTAISRTWNFSKVSIQAVSQVRWEMKGLTYRRVTSSAHALYPMNKTIRLWPYQNQHPFHNSIISTSRTSITWLNLHHTFKVVWHMTRGCLYAIINPLRHEWLIFASVNKPSLVQILACRHGIIWTYAGKLLTGPLETKFSEILIEIDTFSFKQMHLKMSSLKCRPFCLGLYVFKLVW